MCYITAVVTSCHGADKTFQSPFYLPRQLETIARMLTAVLLGGQKAYTIYQVP